MSSKFGPMVLLLAAGAGATVGYVDTRPSWDDTGVTVIAVLGAATLLSALHLRAAWWIGLLVGLPVVVINVIVSRNFGSAAALAVAMVGAGIGRIMGGARSH